VLCRTDSMKNISSLSVCVCVPIIWFSTVCVDNMRYIQQLVHVTDAKVLE
jgi:hypothetical protein